MEQETNNTTEKKEAKKPAEAAPERKRAPRTGGGPHGGRGGRRGGGGPRRGRAPRERSEFDQKTIDVARVARVVAGGRRFSFRVSLVAGDRNGRVGVGLGKGNDTALAVEKAFRDAKKNMIAVARTKENSIPHEIQIKHKTARLMITPAPGKGIIAGSAVRTVLELAGIKDVNAKIFSPAKNKLIIARATVAALGQMKKPREARKKSTSEKE